MSHVILFTSKVQLCIQHNPVSAEELWRLSVNLNIVSYVYLSEADEGDCAAESQFEHVILGFICN